MRKFQKTETEWKKILSPEAYHILREKGTEPPFKNRYHNNKKSGSYMCGACGAKLFSSIDKFDSGTGWPSFTKPLKEEKIARKKDVSLVFPRTEIVCATCDSHLGHVFNHPKNENCPTGKRFCLNSLALNFKKLKN